MNQTSFTGEWPYSIATSSKQPPVVWLDSQDILTRFHISRRTLQNWRSKNLLPYYRVGGGKIFYKESDVLLLLEKSRVIKGEAKKKSMPNSEVK